jgi:uncharacterized protein (DUF2164 family)
MTKITLDSAIKQQLIDKLQDYFEQELQVSLEQFDADFLLDFIAKEMGCHFYNQGLTDAQAILSDRIELVKESIEELYQDIP